ncbi:MAG: type II toxin-antitoxin system VapC family toxin [Leptolyngbyaceae cyanobacterium bins.349]|nr:type II toxin-antitoxin system VapC family toxin [Leptolyngbyaceae cyanobacterium bins.349]
MKLDQAFSPLNQVFIDTAPIVYYVERHPQYFPLVEAIFQRLTAGSFQAITSPITLAECLVLPIRNGLPKLQADFISVITSGINTSFIPVDALASQKAAELRVKYGFKLPDALQLGTAIAAGSDAFLTNDEQLKQVTELQVLVLKELEL